MHTEKIMFSTIATLKTMFFRAVRRAGWGAPSVLLVINVMAWRRNGTFGLGDVRDSLISLVAYTVVVMLIEYQYMRDEVSSEKKH